MQKVKAKLIAEKERLSEIEKKKQQKEQLKYSKESQKAQKQHQKENKKKQIDAVTQWRKGLHWF